MLLNERLHNAFFGHLCGKEQYENNKNEEKICRPYIKTMAIHVNEITQCCK
jgi:hypothetical protein